MSEYSNFFISITLVVLLNSISLKAKEARTYLCFEGHRNEISHFLSGVGEASQVLNSQVSLAFCFSGAPTFTEQ